MGIIMYVVFKDILHLSSNIYHPANWRCWAGVGFMLGYRLRRWPHIKPTYGQPILYIILYWYRIYVTYTRSYVWPHFYDIYFDIHRSI